MRGVSEANDEAIWAKIASLAGADKSSLAMTGAAYNNRSSMKIKHKFKDLEGSRREFTISVPKDVVDKKLDSVYSEMSGVVNVPGFRKGKIPRDILEKHHAGAARERALSDIISDSYRMAAKESNTVPVGLPDISDVEFSEGADLTYRATVDIRPRITMKKTRGIKVKKRRPKIGDEEVAGYIEKLRDSYAQFELIEGRAAEKGDYVICDVICEVDGKPIHDEQKDAYLFLDKAKTLPELVDGLSDSSAGDLREIKAIMPENPKDPQYSKKEALFKVKVSAIKVKKLPKLDDEFVKALGTYKTLDEFKGAVQKDLLRREEGVIRESMASQILEHLLKECQFQVPKALLSEETDKIFNEVKENLKAKPHANPPEDDRIRKSAEKEAVKRIRLYFILDEIARKEAIEVSEEEFDQTLNLLALQSNTTKEKIRENYKQNNLLLPLMYRLRENKVIDFLLKNADVKEIR